MQLIPETARAMGVKDVFDPAQNIVGGTKYLRTLYDRFGDWGKAVAAYNSDAAGKFLADNPEAKIEAAPNYSAYVKPVLDAAEKFGTGGKPAPDITNASVWARREGAPPRRINVEDLSPANKNRGLESSSLNMLGCQRRLNLRTGLATAKWFLRRTSLIFITTRRASAVYQGWYIMARTKGLGPAFSIQMSGG
jgi:hypothetical protein